MRKLFRTKLKDRIFAPYTELSYSKASYVFHKYATILKGKILDVGGGEGYLRRYLEHYINVDLLDTADIKLNLEKETLPFKENSFDCVLCLDVLEHLDNLHDIFDKICKITKVWLISSLPNCRPFSFLPWRRLNEFWGLPVNRPGYRHKWYYYSMDAVNFIKSKAEKNNMTLIQIDWVRKRFKKYALWAVLKKN